MIGDAGKVRGKGRKQAPSFRWNLFLLESKSWQACFAFGKSVTTKVDADGWWIEYQ